MRRKYTDSLIQWKKNPHRHPLLLQGLRQTGKTWLALDFAEKNYKNILYLNLETDKPVTDYLSVPRPPQDALLFLETYAGKPLKPSVSLLILDNIQCVPELSTLLAAISLDYPQYHIIAITEALPPLSSTAKMISILSSCILWISRNSSGQMRNMPYPGKSTDTSPPWLPWEKNCTRKLCHSFISIWSPAECHCLYWNTAGRKNC